MIVGSASALKSNGTSLVYVNDQNSSKTLIESVKVAESYLTRFFVGNSNVHNDDRYETSENFYSHQFLLITLSFFFVNYFAPEVFIALPLKEFSGVRSFLYNFK